MVLVFCAFVLMVCVSTFSVFLSAKRNRTMEMKNRLYTISIMASGLAALYTILLLAGGMNITLRDMNVPLLLIAITLGAFIGSTAPEWRKFATYAFTWRKKTK